MDSTLRLVSELKRDISEFEERVEELNEKDQKKITPKDQQLAAKEIQIYINDLIERIEESIPLISLALTTSGAHLSSRMPDSVSPGRFLQAGRFLSEADSKYESFTENSKTNADHTTKAQPITVQVGPTFTVTMYTIFYGQTRHISWKEEFRRCRIRLWRVNDLGAQSIYQRATDSQGNLKKKKYVFDDTDSDASVYRYVMTIDESFKDDRYHDDEEKPQCKVLDLGTVMRLFFSASGKLLQIDESRSPVLVLKLNPKFDLHLTEAPNNDSDDESTEGEEEEVGNLSYNSDRLLNESSNVEWLAFEQYFTAKTDTQSDEEDEEEEEEDSYITTTQGLSTKLESLSLESGKATDSTESTKTEPPKLVPPEKIPLSKFKSQFNKQKASLSLLEYLIRLAALQSNDQESVYNTADERIALYLTDESADQHGSRPRTSTDTDRRSSRKPSTPNKKKGTELTPWEKDRLDTRKKILQTKSKS